VIFQRLVGKRIGGAEACPEELQTRKEDRHRSDDAMRALKEGGRGRPDEEQGR